MSSYGIADLDELLKSNPQLGVAKIDELQTVAEMLESGTLAENRAASVEPKGDPRLKPPTEADRFAELWYSLGGPKLKPEHKFHNKRRWRFDFALPDRKVAIEIEGGVWGKGKKRGRHTRGQGYINDCHKYNSAVMDGWRIFRLATGMVRAEFVEPIIKSVQ